MSQAAPKWRACPFCEERYRICGWHYRRRSTYYAKDGRWLDDVHLVSCARKNGMLDEARTVEVSRELALARERRLALIRRRKRRD